MDYSLNWLTKWVPLDEETNTILDRLTNLGLTVEGIREEKDDTLFGLDLTTNRPDCLSHLGVARELSSSYNRPMVLPKWKSAPSGKPASAWTSVTLDDSEGCPRYACAIIHDVRVGPSPAWLSSLLERIGIRSINNVVDITNYVLAAVGQPLHAFDYDKLAENRIVVRKAKKGEKITTLDGIERTLEATDVVIADAAHAVALAGIMGGEETEIGTSTKTVLLESAYFEPVTIRRTGRRIGLTSEASQRFSRGLDPTLPLLGLEIAAHLFEKLACGTVSPEPIDIYPKPVAPPTFNVRKKRITSLLGLDPGDAFIETTLNRLGIETERSETGWNVTAPLYRVDINEEVDIVEEIARHYGYNTIPSILPTIQQTGRRQIPSLMLEERVRDLSVACGLTEIFSYAFEEEATPLSHQPLVEIRKVGLSNPLSVNASHLRTSLIPGLMRTFAFNRDRGRSGMALFEIGNVYSKEKNAYVMHRHLGILLSGDKSPLWENPAAPYSFFDMKGACETIMHALGRSHLTWKPLELEGFHPYQCAICRDGEDRLAYCGRLESEEIFLAEIHLPAFIETFNQTPQFIPYSTFPPISIDITLAHDASLSYAKIVRAIEDTHTQELKAVTLKARFESSEPPPLRTTIRLTFRHPERSLTQEEINNRRDELVARLTQDLPVTV